MANLIDVSFFESGLRTIPNVDKQTVKDRIEQAITTYQDYFLKEQFGYEFQKLMLANPTDPIYANVIDGAEWTDYNGFLQKWDGLLEPLADYVFYKFIKENIIKFDGVGFSASSTENASLVQPIQIPVMVYNRFVEQMEHLYDYLIYSDFDYSKIKWQQRRFINEFGI